MVRHLVAQINDVGAQTGASQSLRLHDWDTIREGRKDASGGNRLAVDAN